MTQEHIQFAASAATSLPNAILSVFMEPWPTVIIRVRIDNLIRYVHVSFFQIDGHDIFGGDNPRILQMDFPADVKCFELQGSTHNALELRPSTLRPEGLQDALAPSLSIPTHDVALDYDTFTVVQPLARTHILSDYPSMQSDMLCVVKHPALQNQSMLRKIAEVPDLRIVDPALGLRHSLVEIKAARDIAMHRLVAETGLGIAPAFFGHVTERGRGIIGFLYEYMEDARSLQDLQKEGYKLTDADMAACRDVVRKLHEGGFGHGTLLRRNVLRRANGCMVLIDFSYTHRVGDQEVDGCRETDLASLKQWQEER